jgi:hypothetical protein
MQLGSELNIDEDSQLQKESRQQSIELFDLTKVQDVQSLAASEDE